jgi:hypothetical protein
MELEQNTTAEGPSGVLLIDKSSAAKPIGVITDMIGSLLRADIVMLSFKLFDASARIAPLHVTPFPARPGSKVSYYPHESRDMVHADVVGYTNEYGSPAEVGTYDKLHAVDFSHLPSEGWPCYPRPDLAHDLQAALVDLC